MFCSGGLTLALALQWQLQYTSAMARQSTSHLAPQALTQNIPHPLAKNHSQFSGLYVSTGELLHRLPRTGQKCGIAQLL